MQRAMATMLGLGLLCSGCAGNDELDRYSQRKDTVTLSAGDAKETNARTHMLNPWPHGVGDRRIIAEGSRAVRAAEQYRGGGSSAGGGGGGNCQNPGDTAADGSRCGERSAASRPGGR